MTLALAAVLAAAFDAGAVLRGPLLPEGSPWNAPGAVVLADPGDALTLSLARPIAVRALLLQADSDDTYRVEGSVDGARWELLWAAPALPPPGGLRSRWVVLSAPAAVGQVRVRATSGLGGFSVARLWLFEALPPVWPPALDRSLPVRAALLFPTLSPARVLLLRATLAGLAFAVVLWTLLRPSRTARLALYATAGLAAFAWTNFGNLHFDGLLHQSEMYHYYVGAKYFPELGYDGLYACTLEADAEDGVHDPERPVRDLRTNHQTTAGALLAGAAPCRPRFGDERWAAFRADVAFFRELRGGEWRTTLTDHGHNATPAWNLAGRALTSLVPASRGGLTLLAALDLALLLGLAFVLLKAFGAEAAAIATIYFGTNALARFAWTGGALLRYDWLFLALTGLAALRLGRPRTAGFALGWATLVRVFPGVLLLGVALHAVAEAVVDGPRQAWNRLRPVLAGAALAFVAIGALSEACAGRPAAWASFVSNSRKYLHSDTENKLGLVTALAYRPETEGDRLYDPLSPDPFADWQAAQAANARRMLPVRVLLAGLYLVLLLGAARWREPWLTAALAAGLLPVLFQQANYYYTFLAAFALPRSRLPSVALGLVGLAWASEVAAQNWATLDVRAAVLSALVCVYVYWAAWRAARGGP